MTDRKRTHQSDDDRARMGRAAQAARDLAAKVDPGSMIDPAAPNVSIEDEVTLSVPRLTTDEIFGKQADGKAAAAEVEEFLAHQREKISRLRKRVDLLGDRLLTLQEGQAQLAARTVSIEAIRAACVPAHEFRQEVATDMATLTARCDAIEQEADATYAVLRREIFGAAGGPSDTDAPVIVEARLGRTAVRRAIALVLGSVILVGSMLYQGATNTGEQAAHLRALDQQLIDTGKMLERIHARIINLEKQQP